MADGSATTSSPKTLADLLEKDAPSFETLHAKYGSLLELVRALIGVVPNCDRYLEVWPPAFRSYNVMVPNLLNLPLLVWGMGAPKAMVGLGMYVTSRATGCPYCSAHACSFAMRRGATADQVIAAMEDDALLAPDARAVTRVARSLATSTLSSDDRAELLRHFKPADAEWIVLGIAMMGWLTKSFSALGVPLELSTVEEVNAVMPGFSPGVHLRVPYGTKAQPKADSLGTKLGLIRHAPSAVALDKKWTEGVPAAWPAIGEYLRSKTGHDFPILGRLQNKRAARAIATMIREQFAESVVGRDRKLSAGLVYAKNANAPAIEAALHAVGARELDDSPVEAIARGASPRVPVIDDAVLEAGRALPSEGIVEVVTFIALLQLLHRLEVFYPSA